MRLEVHSSTGRFDILHPSDVSVNTRISILGAPNGYPFDFYSVNITTTEHVTDWDPETLAELIRDYHSKYICSSDRRKKELAFADYIRTNSLDIHIGNHIEMIHRQMKENREGSARLERLTNSLALLKKEKEEE